MFRLFMLLQLLLIGCDLIIAKPSFYTGGDPQITMDAVDLITSNGYPAETYQTTTADGYILTIHRIPYGRNGFENITNNRPVAFLQHGLLCSSTNWIANLANESLGFIMADAGFDVWLGNFRGNTYSRRHITLDPSEHPFWEFSWDEMAKHDLPAMIYKVLAETGSEQLYYVGHSQGTMTAFAKFSQDADLASRIKHFFALAPVAKVGHISGLLAELASRYGLFTEFIKLVDNNEFLPNDWLMDILAKRMCGFYYTNPLCSNILFLVAGPDSGQMNVSRIPVYIGHAPAGTSTQNIIHFCQGLRDNTFAMFDYGSASKNKAKYGQAVPPQYHPQSMTVPVSLFSGQSDWLADPTDVQWLQQNLMSIAHHFKLNGFNHLDFIWGMRAADEIYSKVVDIATKDFHRS